MRSIRENIWRRMVFIAMLCSLVALAVTVAPIGRLVGMFEGWIGVGALVIGGVLWFPCSRNLVLERGGESVQKFIGTHGFELAMTASILPLIAVWSGAYVHWGTMYGAFLGRIPWSDSSSYYAGAAAFLEEGELDRWTSRRPMNTLFLAVRYAACGRWLEGSLVLQALVGGIGLFLSTRRVASYFGGVGAAFFFGLSYAFYRVFVPTTMSDVLGFTLGLLTIPLLLDAVYRRSDWFSMIAVAFILAFGQVIRPGTMFLLPAFLLWAFVRFNVCWRNRILVLGLCVIAMAIPNVANKACLVFYGPGGENVQLNSNFSLTFYGFTIGTDWKGAETAIDSGGVERLVGETWNDAIYRQGAENIKMQPGVFLKTLSYNMMFSLVTLPAHVGDMLFGVAIRRNGFSPGVLVPLGTACLLLFSPAFLALWRRIRHPDIPQLGFWLLALFAMVASFPIIVRDGSFRVLASTYPLFVVMLAVVLAGPDVRPSTKSRTGLAAAGFSIALLVVVMIAPSLLRSQPGGAKSHEPGAKVIVVGRNEIQAVVISEAPQSKSIAASFRDRVSTIDYDEFQHLLKASRVEFSDRFEEFTPPFTLLVGLEQASKTKHFMVISGNVDSFAAPYYRFSVVNQRDIWRDVTSFEEVELK